MCLKCDSVVSGCQKLLQMQALGRSRSLGTPEGGVAGVGKAGWHGHERLKAVDLAAEEIAVHQAIQATQQCLTAQLLSCEQPVVSRLMLHS